MGYHISHTKQSMYFIAECANVRKLFALFQPSFSTTLTPPPTMPLQIHPRSSPKYCHFCTQTTHANHEVPSIQPIDCRDDINFARGVYVGGWKDDESDVLLLCMILIWFIIENE